MFEIFDWNKIQKDKLLGVAHLNVSTILEGGGGLFSLAVESGKGTIEVFARALTLNGEHRLMKLRREGAAGYEERYIESPPARFVLEKDVFRPGEVIRGHLIWKSHESIKLRDMWLQFQGKAVYNLSDTTIIPQTEPAFAKEWIVVNEVGRIFGQNPSGDLDHVRDSPISKPQKLKKGKIYIWSFQFLLPDRLPPSSYGTPVFSCKYQLSFIALQQDTRSVAFNYYKDINIVPPIELLTHPVCTPKQLEVRASNAPHVIPFDYDEPNGFKVDWGETKSTSTRPMTNKDMWVFPEGKYTTSAIVSPATSTGAVPNTAVLKNFHVSIINHFVISYRVGLNSTDGAKWKFLPLHVVAETCPVSGQELKLASHEPVQLNASFELKFYGYPGPLTSVWQSIPPGFFPEMIESYHHLEITATVVDTENSSETPKRMVIGKKPITLTHARFFYTDVPIAAPRPELLPGKFRVIEVTDAMVNKALFISPDRLRQPEMMDTNLDLSSLAFPPGALSYGPVLADGIFMNTSEIYPMRHPVLSDAYTSPYDWPAVTMKELRDPAGLVPPQKLLGPNSSYVPSTNG